jgi:HNH endonuclease
MEKSVTVYGPYTRKDGRKHVIHYDGITRHTQSYPRYLMEQHLGRRLEKWEHVDHKNDDYTDDRIENLQILTQLENNKKSAKPTEYKFFSCPVCLVDFSLPVRVYKANQIIQNKAGPYCSKQCAGKAHH